MNTSLILILFIHFFKISKPNNISLLNEEQLEKSTYKKVEVCAKAGCFRGKVERGRTWPYDAFYGIPYAEPPVGKLRFENPVPRRRWTGYWNATYPRDACLQRNVYVYNQPLLGSEDCLYLNVYRPLKRWYSKKIPVLVYIHVGPWLYFSTHPEQAGPEYFMDNGEVIVVTFNYRLGLLGLLCSGDEAIKGNFALKDQQLAMKWIVNNIEYFGGDSNSITLIGFGAGAASIHLHMMNPVSQALFHRAVLMSGTATSPWNHLKDYKTQFRQSAHAVGLKNWETASTFELAKQFKEVDALAFATAVDNFFAFAITPLVPFCPCVEGNWRGAFLREDPRKLWAEGRYFPKPVFLGTITNEGGLGAVITRNETLLPIFNENIHTFLPIMLSFDPTHETEVLKHYLNGKDSIDSSNEEQFFKMLGDRLFLYPLISFVNQFIRTANTYETPIFIYEFNFTSNYTTLKTFTGLDINFPDDLFYLFTMSEFVPKFNTTSPEGKMVDVFVRTIVSFAKRGEVIRWRNFRSCNILTSTPFCHRQIFQRYTKIEPNQVQVTISNEIDMNMMKFWSKIDEI